MKPHPWFNPPWRRWLTLILCVVWMSIEAIMDASGIWFWITALISFYAAYHLFFANLYPVAEDPKE